MIEIEKKYRLSKQQRDAVVARLKQIGARSRGEEVEENTIYGGVRSKTSVLRLRRSGKIATLTYKERFASPSPIKHQREDETVVKDPAAMDAILTALGFTPALIYEKRRQTWRLGRVEVVIDELPFGLFMEIEGSEDDILATERQLGLKGLRAEHATYPQLAKKHGKRSGRILESRFK